MICHTCAFQADIPSVCSECKSDQLEKVGIGTQQIEESMQQYFPKNNIFRFDTDSVANKSEKEKVLEKINAADIIIGTKMITTGFNIPNLGIIAVILLEQELSMPQYDIEERLYSNMKQLIGRGNRN
jgi:primosomal protein N' (replication factor Y)